MTFNEVILGCSPFIGGVQFGHRSRLYELDFKNQPENIVKIMNKTYDLGVKNILLKPHEDLINAVNLSKKEGYDWNIIGITNCENFEYDQNLFQDLSASTVLISGDFVDKNVKENTFNILESYLSKIDKYFTPGVESYNAFQNTYLIEHSSICNMFDVYMIPLNYYGYMIDCNFFKNENKVKYGENISSLNKKVIANRTLATGILKPVEAYEYLKKIDFIDSVCVGVAKIEEAEETFGVINKRLH